MDEGSHWLAAALAQQEARLISESPSEVERALRARGLYWLARFSVWQGDEATPLALYEESLAIFQELKDTEGIASTLGDLSTLYHMRGDHDRAILLAQQCLMLFRELGETGAIAWGLALLGWPNFTAGDIEQASVHWQESLTLFRAGNHQWGIASVLINLAKVAFEQGDYPRMNDYLTESMTRYRELGERWQIIHALDLFAYLVAAQAQQQEDPLPDGIRAARILGAVEVLCETFGTPLRMFRGAHYEQVIFTLRTQIDDATFAAAFAEGQGMTLEQAVEYALS
jgi:tetratricopeptide (TPR) repeat protein